MKRYIFYAMALFFLSSCLSDFGDWKKVKDITLDPLMEFPLVDSKVRFQDFDNQIEKFRLGRGETDNTLTLYYSENVLSRQASDYYNFDYFQSEKLTYGNFDSGGSGSFPPMTFTWDSEIFGRTQSDALQLEQVRFRSGTMIFHVNSDFAADVSFNISSDFYTYISDASHLNVGGPVSLGDNQFEVDMSNTLMVWQGHSGLDANAFPFTVEVTVNSTGAPVLPAQRLEIYMEIVNPVWSLLYGIADYRSFELGDGTESVEVLGPNTNLVDFALAEPKVGVEIHNSFGLEVSIDVSQFSVTDRNNSTIDLTGALIEDPNPITISAPALGSPPEVSTVMLDKDNSNLPDLISRIPSSMTFAAEAYYPGGTERVFISDTSTLKVWGKAVLPLHGYVNGITFTKEFDLNPEILDQIEEGELLLRTVNFYPVDIGITLEFYDSTGNYLTSLLETSPLIVQSPALDATGAAVEPVTVNTIIPINPETKAAIAEAVQIKMIFNMSTGQGGTTNVRFTTDDYIDIHIGLKGRVLL